MVSRNLVDATVIVGLVLGAVGVFYLSNGLFDESVTGALRGLVGAVVAGALIVAKFMVVPYLPVTNDHLSTLQRAGFLALGLSSFVVLQYCIRHLTKALPQLRQIMFWTFAACGAAIALVISLYYILVRHSPMVGELPLDAALLLGCAIGLRLLFESEALTDRQLQLFGLILTLLGIATQFVPPVLDLLNIKVV